MEKVKWIVFQKKLGRTIRYSTVIRIELLNQICGLPAARTGALLAKELHEVTKYHRFFTA